MLKGKAALVTGSTSGIGLGMARAFAAEGCKVMLNGLGDAAEIEATRAALAEEFGVEVRYNGADMTKPDQIAAMVEEAENAFGSLDILVNNAGIQHTAAIPDFPDAKWEAVIAINLSAVFYGTKAALPGMQKRGWGRIVNIASAHGKVASPNKSAYVAAKHGVVGLTKVTALENAGKGVTCNAICPGWVRTDLVERQIEALAEKLGVSVEEGAVELLREKQPSLQFVTPEQLGGFAVFLCGPAAEQITGAALSMDGGWTAI
ncbi:MAG: 3-hydroxybutyrate dehydrogenase [Limibacillus sp.]|jgi:3-hydroxybutyrate dehydrogenase